MRIGLVGCGHIGDGARGRAATARRRRPRRGAAHRHLRRRSRPGRQGGPAPRRRAHGRRSTRCSTTSTWSGSAPGPPPTSPRSRRPPTAVCRSSARSRSRPTSRPRSGSAPPSNGCPHQVGLVLRWAPVFRNIADAVASGEYGRVLAAVMRDDQYFPVQGLYGSTWRGDVAHAGGGTVIEHSIHDVDVLRWTLGDPVEVSARTASRFGYAGIEDTAAATFTYADGRDCPAHERLAPGAEPRVEPAARGVLREGDALDRRRLPRARSTSQTDDGEHPRSRRRRRPGASGSRFPTCTPRRWPSTPSPPRRFSTPWPATPRRQGPGRCRSRRGRLPACRRCARRAPDRRRDLPVSGRRRGAQNGQLTQRRSRFGTSARCWSWPAAREWQPCRSPTKSRRSSARSKRSSTRPIPRSASGFRARRCTAIRRA